ncbi:hypothetical protein [Rhizobium leucaenae]|jgi:negative regulator of sigma E activity|uniref:Negative regulator of sigma E activity n=1 Tax=Rhizobium leucaenae TaxID=29450 RepID=A0A7W6ZV49_9HYPH|nr:hypothetical protein [Rhizobium leucaenae]MBB4568765.1 negative regulator of sigma E activity [Rhizobium leucaenae]MBB6302157.1 negative regulator of sigma E activity [Rhizobium leucaenae]
MSDFDHQPTPTGPQPETPPNWRSRMTGLAIVAAIVILVVIAAVSSSYWRGNPATTDPQTTSSTTLPGSGPGAGTVNNTQPNEQMQPAPADRSENNQRGITSTPSQPSRDGVQR